MVFHHSFISEFWEGNLHGFYTQKLSLDWLIYGKVSHDRRVLDHNPSQSLSTLISKSDFPNYVRKKLNIYFKSVLHIRCKQHRVAKVESKILTFIWIWFKIMLYPRDTKLFIMLAIFAFGKVDI